MYVNDNTEVFIKSFLVKDAASFAFFTQLFKIGTWEKEKINLFSKKNTGDTAEKASCIKQDPE